MGNVNYIDMKTAAGMLGAKPKKLIDALEDEKVFHRDRMTNRRMPKEKYIAMGYFHCVLTDYQRGATRQFYQKPVTTPNGLQFLREFIERLPNRDEILIKGKGQCQSQTQTH